MSEKGSVHEQKSGREIPVRRIADISNLPNDYSTTPGGSIFSTTPGGMDCVKYLLHGTMQLMIYKLIYCIVLYAVLAY